MLIICFSLADAFSCCIIFSLPIENNTFLSIHHHSIYRKWLNVNWLMSQWIRQCDNVTTYNMHTIDRKVTFWGKQIVTMRVFWTCFQCRSLSLSVIQNTFVYNFLYVFVWPWINILTFAQHQISKQNDFKY